MYHELHAPRLLASEVANAPWRKARLEEVGRSAAGSIVEAIARNAVAVVRGRTRVVRGDPARTPPAGL